MCHENRHLMERRFDRFTPSYKIVDFAIPVSRLGLLTQDRLPAPIGRKAEQRSGQSASLIIQQSWEKSGRVPGRPVLKGGTRGPGEGPGHFTQSACTEG